MEALAAEPRTFGQVNFGSAQLGDKRRTARLVKTADLIVQQPGGTLPDKLQSPAALDGLYRLVDQPTVTHASVLQGHREQTFERMRCYEGTVLAIHDTTELDYTSPKSLEKLGPIGDGKGRGYECHNRMAVVAETDEVLEIGVSLDTLAAYRARFAAWLADRQTDCSQRGIRYVRLASHRPLASVVLEDLRRGGVVR